MSWALSLPVQTLKDSSARHVLLCLANYAGSNGTGAFPSASTLAQDTGLSERTVRYKLDDLEKSGLIQKGNQAIAAVHIDRHDRRFPLKWTENQTISADQVETNPVYVRQRSMQDRRCIGQCGH